MEKDKKTEYVMMLCERCSERIADRYYLEPRPGDGACSLCGREAKACAITPRKRINTAGVRTGFAMTGKGMENTGDRKARWKEPWRES